MAARARFLVPEKLASWRERQSGLDAVETGFLDDLARMIAENKVEPRMNRVVGELLQSAMLQGRAGFMADRTARYAFEVMVPVETRTRIRLHKRLCRELVFGSSALQQIEAKGARILRQMTDWLTENYLAEKGAGLALVPDGLHRTVMAAGSAAERARLLCDHLSGMTDAFALRSFKRLFDPDFSTISELV